MTCEILSYLTFKELPVGRKKQNGVAVDMWRDIVPITSVTFHVFCDYIYQLRIFLRGWRRRRDGIDVWRLR